MERIYLDSVKDIDNMQQRHYAFVKPLHYFLCKYFFFGKNLDLMHLCKLAHQSIQIAHNYIVCCHSPLPQMSNLILIIYTSVPSRLLFI